MGFSSDRSHSYHLPRHLRRVLPRQLRSANATGLAAAADDATVRAVPRYDAQHHGEPNGMHAASGSLHADRTLMAS